MGRKPVNKIRKLNPQYREKYVRKLLPVFQQYGINHYTMEELTEIIGISKATFYQYFTSKEEMISVVLKHILSNIRAFEPVLGDNSLTFKERYFNALRILSENVSGISDIMLSDLREGYPQHWNLVEQFTEYSTEILKNFYDAGISAGEFHALNSKLLALSDQIFINTISDPQQLKKLGMSLGEALNAHFRIKCYGLLPESPED